MMNLSKIVSASLMALAATIPSVASAQEQEAENVYMRRPLPLTPSSTSEGFRWETTTSVVDLNGNPVDETNYCGPVIRRNESICVSIADGRRVGDAYCGSTSRPPSEREEYIGTGCTFSWNTTPWDEGGASCTSSEYQTRSVSCRNQNNEVVADSFCSGTKPASARTVADYSGCTGDDPSSTPTVRWGAWTYDQTCSATATKTRRGTCQVDGSNVADNVCTDIGIALTETVQEPNYAGCSYSWKTETWGEWSNTCGTGTRTRTVTCERSNGEAVADSFCSANPKPATSETRDVTSGCPTNACFGPVVILTSEDTHQDCDNFAAGLPSCPAGTTEGDPGQRDCVTSVSKPNATNCSVFGREVNSLNCTAPEPESEANCQRWQGPRVFYRQDPTQTTSFEDAKTTGGVCSAYNRADCSGEAESQGSPPYTNYMDYGYAEYAIVYDGAVRYLNSGFINNSRAVSGNKCVGPNGGTIGSCSSVGGKTQSSVSMTLGGVTYTMNTRFDGNTAVVASISTSGSGGASSVCSAEELSGLEQKCTDTMFGTLCNEKKYYRDTNQCAGYMAQSTSC